MSEPDHSTVLNEPACKELFDEFLEEKKNDLENVEWILTNIEITKADIANGVEELQELKRLILLTWAKIMR